MQNTFENVLVDDMVCDVMMEEGGIRWVQRNRMVSNGWAGLSGKRKILAPPWLCCWCNDTVERCKESFLLLFEEIIGIEKRTPIGSGGSHGIELFTFRRGLNGLHGYQWFPWKIRISVASKSIEEELFAALSTSMAASSIISRRPKRLLVIVNPLSGRGQAMTVLETIVLPVLRCSGIATHVEVTERQGHATDIVQNALDKRYGHDQRDYHNCNDNTDLQDVNDTVDGIIALGGDGLFHEVTRGLFQFLEKKGIYSLENLDMRLAHIPCGSTDAVACSLNGSRSAFNATAHVALGDCTALDVARITVNRNNQQIYATCIAAYGFMADVVKSSEQYRPLLGPLRYDVVGFFKLLANKSYRCRVSWKEPSKEISEITSKSNQSSPFGVERLSSQDIDRNSMTTLDNDDAMCVKGCRICRSAGIASASYSSLLAAETGNCRPSAGRSDSLNQSLLSYSSMETPRSSEVLVDKTIEGNFMSIMVIVQPCRSDKTRFGMARHAHLANGLLTLVLVHQCSPLQFLRFLSTMSSSGLAKYQLPYVEVIDAVSCQIAAAGERERHEYWNVDGELCAWDGMLEADALCGALKCFARGCELKACT